MDGLRGERFGCRPHSRDYPWGTRIRNKAPWYRVPLRAAHSQIHVEEVMPKAPVLVKKKPTFYQQKPSQDNMGFPGGEGAPVTGPGQAASWRGGSSRPATGVVSPSSRRGTRPDSGTRHYLPRW